MMMIRGALASRQLRRNDEESAANRDSTCWPSLHTPFTCKQDVLHSNQAPSGQRDQITDDERCGVAASTLHGSSFLCGA